MMRASPTRMGGWFIADHKDLRLKKPLQAALKSVAYTSLEIDARSDSEVQDIVFSDFKWKTKFLVVRAVFPLLCFLRLVDSNEPTMPLVFYACLQVEECLKKSCEELDAHFDPGVDDESITVSGQMIAAFEQYAPEIKHTWAKAGFVLNPNLIEAAKAYLDQGDLILACRSVVSKIFYGDPEMDLRQSEFSQQLAQFQAKAGPWHTSFVWSDSDLTSGRIHVWHKRCSTPFAATFGKVGIIIIFYFFSYLFYLLFIIYLFLLFRSHRSSRPCPQGPASVSATGSTSSTSGTQTTPCFRRTRPRRRPTSTRASAAKTSGPRRASRRTRRCTRCGPRTR